MLVLRNDVICNDELSINEKWINPVYCTERQNSAEEENMQAKLYAKGVYMIWLI